MSEIQNSRNIVNASIDANGNVVIGDGNTIINLKEAAQYKALEADIKELDRQYQTTQAKQAKYPDDEDFPQELLRIDEKRQQKKEDLASLKSEVLKLADDFQRIPIDTERLRLAKQYFEVGEFDKARAVFDAETMGMELDALLIEKEQLSQKTSDNQQNLEDKANEYLILARLTATDFELPDRFEKTQAYFEQSLRADKNDENLFAYAYFLQEHKQYSQAQPLYEEALQIRKQLAGQNHNIYLPRVAGTLNNLGILCANQNEFRQAQPLYKEALQKQRALAEENPKKYLPDVASTMNNLAISYLETEDFNLAKPLLEEALQIRRQLAQANSQTYLPHVVSTLNNLGSFYCKRTEYNQAQPRYEEALEISRRLVKLDSQSYLSYVANTLNNLATLYKKDKDKFDKAHILYEEALQIQKKLAQHNPHIYLPDVAMTLNDLANLNLYYKTSDYHQAQPLLKEALQIYRQLVQHNPQTYLTGLATTLNNLAVFYHRKNDYHQAQPQYEEALNIQRQLAQHNPQAYNLEVAMTSINMGLLYEQWLATTGDKAMKTAGLELMREATQCLAIFPAAHPRVQQYQTYIERLTAFFQAVE